MNDRSGNGVKIEHAYVGKEKQRKRKSEGDEGSMRFNQKAMVVAATAATVDLTHNKKLLTNDMNSKRSRCSQIYTGSTSPLQSACPGEPSQPSLLFEIPYCSPALHHALVVVPIVDHMEMVSPIVISDFCFWFIDIHISYWWKFVLLLFKDKTDFWK